MGNRKTRAESSLERLSIKFTNWVGTPTSIILHTLFFVGIFGLRIFGVGTDSILLILTTAVSLEAIYLAIFIQMTVNRQSVSLKSVEEDIDEIQEDVEDLQEEVEEDDVVDAKTQKELEKIEAGLQTLLQEVEKMKKN